MVSQAKMLVKGKNWVHGAKDQDDQVGQIKGTYLAVIAKFMKHKR